MEAMTPRRKPTVRRRGGTGTASLARCGTPDCVGLDPLQGNVRGKLDDCYLPLGGARVHKQTSSRGCVDTETTEGSIPEVFMCKPRQAVEQRATHSLRRHTAGKSPPPSLRHADSHCTSGIAGIAFV